MTLARDQRAGTTPAVADALRGEAGYCRGLSLQPDELAMVKGWIEAQWLARLRAIAPEHCDGFAADGIGAYHRRSERIDHARVWPKAERILPAEAVAEIRSTSIFDALGRAFGELCISDEEGLGREEIYWRIVRPQQPGDTGPVHADRWFWDLGHGVTPDGLERVKLWVAVVCEPGLSGLRLLPGSHRKTWRYHGEERHGMTKPQIDEDVDALGLELMATEPGDAVVFHDQLLHGGGIGRGKLTRVSFECTLFVRPYDTP